MAKVLKVIDPILRLDYGDIFEQNEDGDYVSTVREDFTNSSEDGNTYTTKYHADFTISKDYAEQLVKEKYLKEIVEDEKDNNVTNDKKFVNVFDEIDNLIEYYTENLNALSEPSIHPAVAHEGQVVYNNILSVLKHLKSLRK